MLLRWNLIFFCIFFVSVNSTQTKVRKEKGVDFVDLDEKDTDDIVMKWNEQAISGVMAAVASKNAKYLTKDELKDLESCSKNANTIERHAECIMPALNAKVYRKEFDKNFQNSQDLIKKLVPTKFSASDGSVEAPEKLKISKEMPKSESRKMRRPASMPKMSQKQPMRKFRTDKIQQRKPSNFRFPQAKRINSAEINRSKFIPKSYRMAKYSTQKIGKKPYRKHFFTAKSLDYRNRVPQLWRSSREKYVSKSKEEYYQQKKVGSFTLDLRRRRKRYAAKSASVVNSINDSQRKLTPIGLFAKFFMDDIIAKRNKTARVPWQNMVEKAKQTAVKKKEMKKRMRMMEQSPLEEMAFKFLDRNGSPPRDMDEMMKKIFSDKDFREAEKKKANAGSPHRKILQLMRDGIKLAFSAAGKNTSNFDDKNLKVMSPKLFSVFNEGDNGENGENGEDDDPIDVLSPSLLSLHGNGKGFERELSLPNLIKGFTTADQQQWLDLIFEASGVEDTIKQAEDALIAQEFQVREKRSYEQRMQSPDGQPLYFTKEKAIETLGNPEAKRIEVSEALIKSYTKNQMKEMNETGYAILSKEQMEVVYGPGSPHADSEKLALFANMSAEEIHRRIEKDIKAMAEKRTIRKKRTILLSPFVNSAVLFAPEVASQPIILSPILFTSVVGSPAVLGPIILGPWLFLPLILSPRLLSPAILNPFLFVPIILSPLALHPAILCPGLFNPIVLSPLALTPFILSPQVFTPIILSPLVLSPFILSPTVGTPVVLSPFVLTPVIYSPLTLFALVLSPNALSPLVESKLYLAEVVLSPSFLS